MSCFFFFFFQAEDGIRDVAVTGVQTCALPISERDLVIDRVSLESGATLQRGSVYLVPLLESLALPERVRGRSNPKSTTGRLDIFTRVITDATPRFDEVRDRKSTRLNSSHGYISYAVFCLKKKKSDLNQSH